MRKRPRMPPILDATVHIMETATPTPEQMRAWGWLWQRLLSGDAGGKDEPRDETHPAGTAGQVSET